MKRLGYDNLDSQFPLLNRYWADREFARKCDAEARHLNELSMSAMDRGIAKYRRDQAQDIQEIG